MVDWITLSTTGGTGNTTVSVTASSYSELLERATSLKISGQTKAVYLTINQKMDASFFLMPSQLYFSYEGGEETVNLTSSTGWTASTSASWLTISPMSGTGNATLTITASENSGDTQNAEVVFTDATGKRRTLSVSISKNMDEYVMCTYVTTSPNQVISLFGRYYNSTYDVTPSYTRYTTDAGSHTTGETYYLDEIILEDGVQYHEIDETVSEYDDAFMFYNAGVHVVYIKFRNNILEPNWYAWRKWVGYNNRWNLRRVPQGPFSYNPNITSIYIPSGITIGAFYVQGEAASFGLADNCTRLQSITSRASGAMVAKFAQNSEALTTVSLVDVDIADYAYSGCTSITSIDLNNKTIGDYAFANSGLRGELSISGSTFKSGVFSGNNISKITLLDCNSNQTNSAFTGYAGELYVDYTEGTSLISNMIWVSSSDITKLTWGYADIGAYYTEKFPASLTEFVWLCPNPSPIQISMPCEYASALTKITVYSTVPFNFAIAAQYNQNFQGVANNGTLYHLPNVDYSSWMSTTPYNLGYYNWSEQTITT